MATFKVGDRVRIIGPEWGRNLGRSGVIWDIEEGRWEASAIARGTAPNAVGYSINVDGVGRYHFGTRTIIAYEAHELAPLGNPDEEAWQEFKKLLQPNPAILLAKVTL